MKYLMRFDEKDSNEQAQIGHEKLDQQQPNISYFQNFHKP